MDSLLKMCKKHLLQKRWGAVFTLWASQEIIEYKIKLKSDSNDGPNDATAHQESAQYARWPVHPCSQSNVCPTPTPCHIKEAVRSFGLKLVR